MKLEAILGSLLFAYQVDAKPPPGHLINDDRQFCPKGDFLDDQPRGDRREDRTKLKVLHYNAEFMMGSHFQDTHCSVPDNNIIACSAWTGKDGQKKHIQDIAAVIDRYDPDIINLCEILDCRALSELRSYLKNKHQYSIFVGKQSDSFTYQACGMLTKVDPTEIEVINDRAPVPLPGSSCPAPKSDDHHKNDNNNKIQLTSSKFDLFELDEFDFTQVDPRDRDDDNKRRPNDNNHHHHDDDHNHHHSTQKSVSKAYMARFELDVGSEVDAVLTGKKLPLTLFGMHFLAQPTDESRCPQREAQAAIIARRIKTEMDSGRSILALGDINDFDTIEENVPYNHHCRSVHDRQTTSSKHRLLREKKHDDHKKKSQDDAKSEDQVVTTKERESDDDSSELSTAATGRKYHVLGSTVYEKPISETLHILRNGSRHLEKALYSEALVNVLTLLPRNQRITSAFHTGSKKKAASAIDHMLISPKLMTGVEDVGVGAVYNAWNDDRCSDHYPVWMSLDLVTAKRSVVDDNGSYPLSKYAKNDYLTVGIPIDDIPSKLYQEIIALPGCSALRDHIYEHHLAIEDKKTEVPSDDEHDDHSDSDDEKPSSSSSSSDEEDEIFIIQRV